MKTKRSNEQWLSDLRSPGPAQEQALADLREIILSGLPYALSKWMSPNDPQFEPLSEEIAQETLLRALDSLDTFEGRSKFTTWVHSIAVHLAVSELRRKRWQEVSLEGLEETTLLFTSRLVEDPSPGPDLSVEQIDTLRRVRRIIAEELTEKQRQVMVAINIRGLPMSEVARRMGTNRNALYKLMHDARTRLKERMASEGLDPREVLALFERE